uniref:Uncharacterized protein n=1 Tax=Globisporangium ultimum (strain ATCC 200006 / CBS 805.95 / DAOM BR144) TaxID=431595 RepID=K3WR01_GLOUD
MKLLMRLVHGYLIAALRFICSWKRHCLATNVLEMIPRL